MGVMLHQICYLILLFFVCSVLGWCMEVVLKYIQYGHFINRGFLIGPYCPIYGSGVVCVVVLSKIFEPIDTSIATTFLISFFGCGILEYAVSYYLEKRFHARWWDYSTKPMNLHGRVWIGNLLLFGIGGTIITKIVTPGLYRLFDQLSEVALYTLSVVIVVIMFADYLASHFVMKLVKSSVESSEADNSESIRLEIRQLMSDKSILHRRLVEAYPDVTYRTDRIKQHMQEIKAEMDRMQQEASENIKQAKQEASENIKQAKQEASENLEQFKQEASENLEQFKQDASYNAQLMKQSSYEIQQEIIQKQDELISCMQNTPENTEEIAMLQEDIEDKKQQLRDKRRITGRVTNK